jgi:hypothetical protein
VTLMSYAEALASRMAQDPEIHAQLQRSAEDAARAALAIVILAIDHDWWCAPIGEVTGAQEASA